MKRYKKYTVLGTVVNMIFYLLSTVPQVSAAKCQDFTCSLGYHTFQDHYLKSWWQHAGGKESIYLDRLSRSFN